MKKIVSIVLAVTAAVFFCNAATAKNIEATAPSTMQQLPAGASTASCSAYATCITITNMSSYPVTIVVPSLFFSGGLKPGYMQPIIANDNYDKQVIIYNHNSDAFFNAFVPSHYDLIVYDFAGKLAAKAK